jgi:DNA-binding CsgD family transcriptional regulator/tetratricopeptide (TPR) repeat protein
MGERNGDLATGARAMELAEWSEARAAYERALAADPGPAEAGAALEGLGQALWFLGEVAEGIAAREAAFQAYADAGSPDDASRVAVWVSHQHYVVGRTSAARGWLARADRALEQVPECAGHGWVAVERARHAVDVEEQAAHCRRAVDVARRTGHADLEVFALSLLGRAESAAGRREEGMRLLEEAMAAASAGVVHNLHTLAEAYCNLVVAATHAGEWERAAEWCERVEEFATVHHAAPLWGSCRSLHADVLLARGHWPEAEAALTEALETAGSYIPELGAPAVASLAELRVEQGRLDEAERLLAGREENPAALRALALLRIADGRPGTAAELLTRGLRSVGGDVMRSAQLSAALVDAWLACDDLARAAGAADELAALAQATGVRLVRARSALAAARVALGAQPPDPGTAAEQAREALAEFGALAMPLDAGLARLELARAVAASSPDLAVEEARAAFTIFRSLGAQTACGRATTVLQHLGRATPARTGADPAGLLGRPLTAREQEVLDLVAQGFTNGAIARRLVISEKTAGHHVSHILAKLGARNRAEAAALAGRAVRR